MEDADHGKALHAREHAGRGHADFRGDEGQLVADAHAELGRGLVADDDAELPGARSSSLPCCMKLSMIDTLRSAPGRWH
jgi:hypothetical protein